MDSTGPLLACGSSESLAAAIGDLAREAGFEYWLYGLDLSTGNHRSYEYLLSGFPPGWIAHYFERDYQRVDPGIVHCQSHATPFVWPASGLDHDPSQQHRRSVWPLYRDARRFGLCAGLTIPVHGLGCHWGLVSFASSMDISQQDLHGMAPHLHLLAHCIHEAAHRFSHAGATPQDPHLTRREVECLRWAAVGKTTWEMSRLLRITERTVIFHLQNVQAKLNARNRQASVARAVVLGLISP